MRYFFKAVGLLVGLAAVVVPTAAQTVWYVDVDATGEDTGQSWDDAFTDLQDALAAAEAGDEVWVVEGTYMPTNGSDRTISFVLVSGVALYGGFDGTEQDRNERDWTVYETVLSGDIGTPQDSTDNSYHVVVASGAGPSTILDGFSVAFGTGAGSAPPDDRGAGVLVLGGAPLVRHCRFYRNFIGLPIGQGEKLGAGIYSESSDVTIESSHFEGNLANGGGGVYFSGGAPTVRAATFRGNAAGQLVFADGSAGLVEDVLIEDGPAVGIIVIRSSPRFVRTTIRGNHSPSDGGGVSIFDGATPVFEDCLFEANTTRDGDGGAVFLINDVSALFLRTTFRGNRALSLGGVARVRAEAVFIGCLFERNSADADGGALRVDRAVTVLGSVFVGNTSTFPTLGGGAVSFRILPLPENTRLIANTVFAGNEASLGGALFGLGTERIRLVNVVFAGNRAREAGGAVYVEDVDGLVIENSILWGNTSPGGEEVVVAGGASPVIAQSIVEGGYAPGTNILDQDPLFVRMPDPGADGQWGTEDDDYGDLRLLEGSPAVDYGLAEYLPADTWDLDEDGDTEEPLPVDLAGNPRQVGGAPDLGAYEGAVRVGIEPGTAPEAPNALRVWPNPASTTLHVEAPGAAEAVVYDVLGREVLRLGSSAEQVAEVDLSGLAPGVYVVRAGGQSAVVTVRR